MKKSIDLFFSPQVENQKTVDLKARLQRDLATLNPTTGTFFSHIRPGDLKQNSFLRSLSSSQSMMSITNK